MNRHDCVPCIHVYNAALTKLCRGTNIGVVVLLLEAMRNMPGCAPDLYSFNTVLACFTRLGNKEAQARATELILKTMPWCGVVPTEYSYSLAITVCVKAGNWEEALELYGHYCDQEKGTVSSQVEKSMPLGVFKGVLLACTKGSEADVALEIINYITRNERRLSTDEDFKDALECYNMGITACSNGKVFCHTPLLVEYDCK